LESLISFRLLIGNTRLGDSLEEQYKYQTPNLVNLTMVHVVMIILTYVVLSWE